MHIYALFLFCYFARIYGNVCPNGSPIYKRGVSNSDKAIIVNLHNNYRMQVANGLLQGQPRGVNLKRMRWDIPLAKMSEAVSNTCKHNHVVEVDPRFGTVGQNIFTSMNSTDDGGVPDWATALYYWFNEYKHYSFGGNIGTAGHYTQVVWADTYLTGCDFIYFKNMTSTNMPYTKIYTCNYGPPGNIYGRPPYQTGQSGCEKLC